MPSTTRGRNAGVMIEIGFAGAGAQAAFLRVRAFEGADDGRAHRDDAAAARALSPRRRARSPPGCRSARRAAARRRSRDRRSRSAPPRASATPSARPCGELVGQEAGAVGVGGGRREQVGAGERGEQREVALVGGVGARQDAVDDAGAERGRDDAGRSRRGRRAGRLPSRPRLRARGRRSCRRRRRGRRARVSRPRRARSPPGCRSARRAAARRRSRDRRSSSGRRRA